MTKLKNLLIIACCLLSLQAMGQKKVLCIGNSFTYVHDAYKRLGEIAASQGHPIDVKASYVGGFSLSRHLAHEETLKMIQSDDFDAVFLQDQSQTPAYYGEAPRRRSIVGESARDLARMVRVYSPNPRIWVEQTWAYEGRDFGGFGSMENFDRLLHKGARKMARKAHANVSPIGQAFALSRSERSDIDLYDPDKCHQSALGAYLKACVNYLLIFGEPFTPAVTDCGNDAEKASYLRRVAERVVLGK